MDVPDPVTEEWLQEAISKLPDGALAEAIATIRGRGQSQADMLDRVLARRDASVTPAGDQAGGAGTLDATIVDAPLAGAQAASVGERSADRSPGQSGELAVGSQFAGYVIEGVAGQGGMGIVYRARQLRPARIVALKVISPQLASDSDFRERFAHESDIAAAIEHSNVIPVYDVGEERDLLYIAMRYVEGTDLRAVITAEGRLAPQRAVDILVELAAALDAAHAHGLVHRDIKPGNVLIAREGRREHVYLTDFGLAKLAAGGGWTRTGMFVGTLDYAAPEQLEGHRVDARTDVYAAGCVLYEMLTGSVPFPQEHQAAIMWAHISAAPRSVRELVPSLPAELDAVIARAMAKAPEDRYPSAGDLARDAVAAAEGQRAMLLERSVATGPAAPAGAAPPTSATGEPPAPRGAGSATIGPAGAAPVGSADGARTVAAARLRPPPPGRLALLSGGVLVVVVIVALALSGVFGSGGHPAKRTVQHPRTTATVRAPTTRTYTNSGLGVSFAYPASWQALSLQGSPADFGIGSGAGETRCALVIERGAGPANASQEAQFGFVRARSAAAARTVKHYQLRAIQAEQGANIAGVGLVRVSGGQGGHLGFFFRGRDVYAFDCITPAASLDRVDRQEFEPLLASVRIG
jgi:predicted Ser/Thr protein kinase